MSMVKHKMFFLAFILFSWMVTGHGQGYEIALSMTNLKDTTVILGHYLNQSMYPDDTASIDSNGHGVFRGSRKLPGGMYIVFLPSTRYFDIIIGEDQQFTIHADTTYFINTLSFSGSLENDLFLDFLVLDKGICRPASARYFHFLDIVHGEVENLAAAP